MDLNDHAKKQINAYLAAIQKLEGELASFVSGLLAAHALDTETHHLNVTKMCLEPKIPAPETPPETAPKEPIDVTDEAEEVP